MMQLKSDQCCHVSTNGVENIHSWCSMICGIGFAVEQHVRLWTMHGALSNGMAGGQLRYPTSEWMCVCVCVCGWERIFNYVIAIVDIMRVTEEWERERVTTALPMCTWWLTLATRDRDLWPRSSLPWQQFSPDDQYIPDTPSHPTKNHYFGTILY